jgi:predicted phosphodiesterase
MRLGVMSDIHGNPIALDAVLADGAARGVDRWWVLGDIVAVGPEPVATLERLANVPHVDVTYGNTERYVLTGDRPRPHADDVAEQPELLDLFTRVESSFSWTRGALAATGWLDWLAALPLEVRVELDDGSRVLGVHGSPGRDDGDGFTPHRPESELADALVGARADIVIAGHTHQPTDRRVDGVRVLNAGSVSNPITDDLRAGYLIVAGNRHGHDIEHHRVTYDREAFLRAVTASGHPEHDYIASFQRGEQYRYPAVRPGAPGVTSGPA